MRINHLTSSVTMEGGGIPVAIRALVDAQMRAELAPLVFGWDEGGESLSNWPEGALVSLPYRRRLCIPEAAGLAEAVSRETCDLLHCHGLWTGSSRVAPFSRLPYLVSPHGMLDAWALRNSRWKKLIAGWWFENRNLRRAACLHALCASEAVAIRNYGLKNPICIIPNGVDLPTVESENCDFKEASRQKLLLFLGRLHPKKGLVNALRALRFVTGTQQGAKDWKFVIAGWDQGGHAEDLKGLCDELGLTHNAISATEFVDFSSDQRATSSVWFIGPAFGETKDALLRQSDAFILPSFSEGLPMAVLEAWAYGLPVMMTEHCNLPEGFEHNAAIRIGTDPEDITRGFAELFQASVSDLKSMGASGRALVERQFTWPQVAAQMKEVYEWMLGGGSRPGCVEG